MIELKNLTKVYKSKKGLKVTAIDQMNLSLSDKGLVFILGKSGSGKSTLLHLLGGLDSHDEGEIIINGKSSKDFQKNDFDSLRNSMIGFVFQDYNLIESFTVHKNIAIAFELQGKKCDKAEVERVLEQVDLSHYGQRMPNELSNGQKQRVAIGRAIIKSPEVLLADEPTGALDSVTGEQIYELLKKLSQEKLVIIVSHDKEAAERYGDRIIHLSDGKIMGDTIHHEELSIETKVRPFHLIKSKLSFTDSFRIGVSSFSIKPIRLLFAIVLASIAFIIFGIVDEFSDYNKELTVVNSLYQSNNEWISISKLDYVSIDQGIYKFFPNLSDAELDNFKNLYPNYQFYPVFKQLSDMELGTKGGLEITQQVMDYFNLDLVAGQLPVKNTDDNEILISIYTLNQLKASGLMNKTLTPSEVIDRTILIHDNTYIMKGVIDTHYNESRYETLHDPNENNVLHAILANESESILNYGIHNVIFVREGYHEDHFKQPVRTYSFDNEAGMQLYITSKNSNTPLSTSNFTSLSTSIDRSDIYWLDNTPKDALSDDEIIIPIDSIRQEIYNLLPNYSLSLKNDAQTFLETYVDAHYLEFKSQLDLYYARSTTNEDYIDYIKFYRINQFDTSRSMSYFEGLAKAKLMLEHFFSNQYTLEHFNLDSTLFNRQIKIVGIYSNDTDHVDQVIVSQDIYDHVVKLGEYPYFLTKLTYHTNQDLKLIHFGYLINDHIQYPINNEISATIDYLNQLIVNISTTSLLIGIGLAVFASLLLYNFISSSIIAKKKDIGILRALGARSKDVFKIFLIESLVVSMINFIISMVGLILLTYFINRYMRHDLHCLITIFSIHFRQVFLMIFISIFIGILSSFLPVSKFAREKPVDIIKSI